MLLLATVGCKENWMIGNVCHYLLQWPFLKDFMSKNWQRIMIFADECTKKIVSSMDTSSWWSMTCLYLIHIRWITCALCHTHTTFIVHMRAWVNRNFRKGYSMSVYPNFISIWIDLDKVSKNLNEIEIKLLKTHFVPVLCKYPDVIMILSGSG